MHTRHLPQDEEVWHYLNHTALENHPSLLFGVLQERIPTHKAFKGLLQGASLTEVSRHLKYFVQAQVSEGIKLYFTLLSYLLPKYVPK